MASAIWIHDLRYSCATGHGYTPLLGLLCSILFGLTFFGRVEKTPKQQAISVGTQQRVFSTAAVENSANATAAAVAAAAAVRRLLMTATGCMLYVKHGIFVCCSIMGEKVQPLRTAVPAIYTRSDRRRRTTARARLPCWKFDAQQQQQQQQQLQQQISNSSSTCSAKQETSGNE